MRSRGGSGVSRAGLGELTDLVAGEFRLGFLGSDLRRAGWRSGEVQWGVVAGGVSAMSRRAGFTKGER